MLKLTRAQEKLVSHILKKQPSLTDNEILSLLNDLKRFVNVVRRIYTEPQARVTYKDVTRGKRIMKNRVFNTNLGELSKVRHSKTEPIENVLRRFHDSVTKHGKK